MAWYNEPKELDNRRETGHPRGMFSFKTCNHPSCHTYVACGTDTCYRHSTEKERLRAYCTMKLESMEVVKDLCITDAEFEGITLPETKEIIASNFAWCTFRDMDFSHAKLISSFFDFCLFEHCTFHDIDCRYSVFSGSEFLHCDFSGSFIVHSNFSGITSIDTSFASSDLYFSSFPTSYLKNTSFEDCNLKKSDFRFSDQKGVSFKYSNYQEARL